ncbi:MAG: hydrogenase iron-sulfur subunit [bacterium]
MDNKLGVYICSGCDIGNCLNIEKLENTAKSEYKPEICKSNEFLCSKEGLRVINEDIESSGLNKIIIAACSMRAKQDVFNFDLLKIYTERVNLREHVIWVSQPNSESAQMLAEDYLRMGITKAKKAEPTVPLVADLNKTILVIGGGVTGLNAALNSAKAGYEVILIEKKNNLGGFPYLKYKKWETAPPFENTVFIKDSLNKLIADVENSKKIRIYKNSEISEISGAPGRFEIKININLDKNKNNIEAASTASSNNNDYKNANNNVNSDKNANNNVNVEIETLINKNVVIENAGAIIAATGWKPYNAYNLAYLGYGLTPDILTNVELEELYSDLYLKNDSEDFTIKRKSDGTAVKSAAFILCAGSRDENHLPYCSAVCCMSSLKEANLFRKNNPDAKVYIIYRDIRTPGEYENYYKNMQNDDGIFMVKGIVSNVAYDGKKNIIKLKVDDTLFGGSIDLNADMLVLAAGMVPNSGDFTANDEISASQVQINLQTDIKAVSTSNNSLNPSCGNKEKASSASCCENPAGSAVSVSNNKSGLLNLTYRQGKEMPDLMYGFPDSNFICFPYESRRTGVYPAGSVRAPMDTVFSVDDAKGAALKAIQCIEQTSKGKAVHPRSNDTTYPFFDLPRCTQCKRCTEECPFGAIDEDEKGTPKPNPERCRRCGVCMGACPVKIISFKNYSVDIIGSMLKSIYVPEEAAKDDDYRILVFACENDAYPAIDILGMNKIQLPSNIRIIPVRCLGSINNVWYADALSRGIDGILLLGCKYGDDYQCHFIKGSELASCRMENIKETLTRLVLESERIRQVQIEFSDYMKLPDILNDFVDKIKSIEPNPYKGF